MPEFGDTILPVGGGGDSDWALLRGRDVSVPSPIAIESFAGYDRLSTDDDTLVTTGSATSGEIHRFTAGMIVTITTNLGDTEYNDTHTVLAGGLTDYAFTIDKAYVATSASLVRVYGPPAASITDAALFVTDTVGDGDLSGTKHVTAATIKSYTDQDLTGLSYAAPLGVDDNYVTDAQLVVIGNTSNTNTGDQTLPTDFVSAASGGSFSGAVTMGSGDKLQFVDAGEYISGDGTDLTIGSGGDIYLNPTGGQVTVQSSSPSDPDLVLLSTSGFNGPQMYFKADSASPAVADIIGAQYYSGNDSSGNVTTYGLISCKIQSKTDPNELGKIDIGAAHGSGNGGLVLEGISSGRVDADIGLGAASVTTVAGNLTTVGTINSIDMSDVASLKSALSLDNVSNDAQMPIAGGIFTGPATLAGDPTNDLHIASKQYVDSKQFSVQTHILDYRLSTVNTWYIGNTSLTTSISASRWNRSAFSRALYTASTSCKVNAWEWAGEISSTAQYQFELWDLTLPADGTAAASTAVQIGSTQQINGTAWAIYTMGESGLSYSLAAGHQLYMTVRYTTGSGNKYTYGATTVDIKVW